MDVEGIARRSAQNGAAIELITELFKILILKNVLTQGEATKKLEDLSIAIMRTDTGTSKGEAVALIDIVRANIANEDDRKPS